MLNRRKIKKKREDCELEILKTISNSSTKDNTTATSSSAFCSYVDHAINDMDPRTQIIVKHQIQDIIFQAQMGNFAVLELPNQAHVNHPAAVPASPRGTRQPRSFMGMLNTGDLVYPNQFYQKNHKT